MLDGQGATFSPKIRDKKIANGVNQSNSIAATTCVQQDTASPRDGFYRSQIELIQALQASNTTLDLQEYKYRICCFYNRSCRHEFLMSFFFQTYTKIAKANSCLEMYYFLWHEMKLGGLFTKNHGVFLRQQSPRPQPGGRTKFVAPAGSRDVLCQFQGHGSYLPRPRLDTGIDETMLRLEIGSYSF